MTLIGEVCNMEVSELISEIHKALEKYDFVSARKYIEENIESLIQNKHRLNGIAKKLLAYLTNGTDPQAFKP